MDRLTLWLDGRGARKSGKPVTRWRNDITQLIGKEWMKVAIDREHWSSLKEAFTFTISKMSCSIFKRVYRSDHRGSVTDSLPYDNNVLRNLRVY